MRTIHPDAQERCCLARSNGPPAEALPATGGDGLDKHHGGLSHSASFLWRLRTRWFFTAMARAFFWPTSTTSCLTLAAGEV